MRKSNRVLVVLDPYGNDREKNSGLEKKKQKTTTTKKKKAR